MNAFLEKHGALKTPRSENEEMAQIEGHGFNDVFYNDDRLDDDMLENQDLQNEMLLDDDMEDEIEMIQPVKKKKSDKQTNFHP